MPRKYWKEPLPLSPEDIGTARAFKSEFADWRLWGSRLIVFGFAAAAGFTVIGFTWLTEQATHLFNIATIGRWRWATLAWTPLCTGLVVWATRRFAPGAAGSGIPQVMATLETELVPADRRLFVSTRLTVAKIVLTTAGLLGGLSLGREGPCVQVAAGVMFSARRWLPRRTTLTQHALLVAGGAAGIAAAFNTPLAGVMFAIEELSRSPEQRSSGLLVACILLAGLMAVSINGNSTYFGIIHATSVGWSILLPGLLVAIASGLTGGLFARLLLASLGGFSKDRFTRWRAQRPVLFAAGCGLAIAVIGIVTGGSTFGSGYEHTQSIIEGHETAPAIFVLLKFVATWLTTWAGVPAGIFAPSLAIGAALGNDIATLVGYPQAAMLIALGMAGFLAAVTQAPLTSFIIVMEMVDGHAMVLSLMACALVASAVSRAISVPLYAALADMQLQRLPRAKAAE